MKLLTLHKRLVYLMVIVPFAALVSGGEMSAAVTIWVPAGLLVSWYWERFGVNPARWGRLLAVGTAVVVGLTILRMVTGGSLSIEPLVDMTLALTVFKLTQRRTVRDYNQIMTLSFLLMAAASAYNPGLAFGFALLIYIIVGTLALSVKHLREELALYHPAERDRFRVGGWFLVTVSGLAVSVLIFSIVFFIAFPRMGFGLFNQAGRSGQFMSGFSDEIQLGDHGVIRENTAVVFRANLEDYDGSLPLRWRGLSFDHYDGRRWTNTTNTEADGAYHTDGRYPASGFGNASLEHATVQEIYLEPLDEDILFGLSVFAAVRFPEENPALRRTFWRESIRVSTSGEMLLDRASERGVHYIAYSVLHPSPDPTATYFGQADFRRVPWSQISGRDYRRAGFPHSSSTIQDRYLQLPSVLTERFYRLAEQVVEGADTPFTRAQLIEGFLKANFAYTTDLPDVSRSNPLESFLFDAQRGHCEYFASAMVLMARAVGIPARNVNGFLGGDSNDFDDYYRVRHSHAHSWVEVLLPDVGWTTFDPTPSDGLPFTQEAGFWAPISEVFDSVRLLWYRYVVDYDLEQQLDAANALLDGLTEGGGIQLNLHRVAHQFYRNFAVVFLLSLLWLVSLWLQARRYRRELVWQRFDWLYTFSWFVLAETLIVLLWRPAPTLTAMLIAAVFPIGTGLAFWALRRAPTSRRQRARKRHGYQAITREYLRLLKLLMRSGYDVTATSTPRSLLEQAKEKNVTYLQQLRDSFELYLLGRFGGAQVLSELKTATYGLKQAIRRFETDSK